MEKCIILLIPALLSVVLLRLLLLPIKGIVKIAVYSGCGFLCLWVLNAVSHISGIAFPMNAATVLIAGFFGIPGIGLLALLAVL